MKSSQVGVAALAMAAAGVAQASEHVERTPFKPTTVSGPFVEQFTDDWSQRWTPSAATKKQSGGEQFSYVGKWSVEEPEVFPGLSGDKGLVLKSKAAQHAISAPFEKPITVDGKPLVVQYETKFQKGLSCGGAYLKLLSESPEGIQAKEFSDSTPYTIMFGPDKCGQTNKVHFIFRHKNPVNGVIEEKHLVDTPYPKLAKTTSLYTLVVNPDNSYEILINNESKKNGTLLDEFKPPVNPEKEIDDPEDSKPSTWVDEARISDPAASKPADWDEDAPLEIPDEAAVKPEGWLEDEPLQVPDPDAVKPEEWDDEEDGEWSPPIVPNPKCDEAPGCGPWTRPLKRNPDYKGKWSAPMIDNPDYKGPWAPRKIANPAYYVDEHPSNFTPMAGIGFELWTMDEDILFDNIYVGHSREDARLLAAETFDLKLPIEQNIEKIKEDADAAEKEMATKAEEKLASATGFVNQAKDQLNAFVVAAKEVGPLEAAKEYPNVAGGIVAIATSLFGAIGLLGGLLGAGGAAAVDKKAKGSKKVHAPSSSSSTSKTKAADIKAAKSTALKDTGNGTSKRTVVTAEEDE